ncbi:hypothetical protein JCM5296_007598 [Sporobolomyces johnsonii]
MRFFSTLMLLGTALAPVLASPYIIKPVEGYFDSGKTFTVTWEDDGNSPSSSSFGKSTLYIATGSSTQHTNLATIGHVTDPASTTEVKITVDATWGPDSTAYFVLLQSDNATDSSGTPLQAFSSRFTLHRMTGSFSSAVQAQLAAYSSASAASSSAAWSASSASFSGGATSSVVSTGSPASSTNKNNAASASSTASGAGAVRPAGGVLGALTLAAAVGATFMH